MRETLPLFTVLTEYCSSSCLFANVSSSLSKFASPGKSLTVTPMYKLYRTRTVLEVQNAKFSTNHTTDITFQKQTNLQ